MAGQNVRLSLKSASRDEAEAMLASGQADLGICQARNRSVGSDMEWRALGAIDMDFYASKGVLRRPRRRFRCLTSLLCRRS
ncbi:LysR family transcriptional regulator [Enterobacter cancerogenus]|uniref:LysR family transcriptional regulator n=1 Tax=Enterobacter cancerogenus TaxID=69218 RepID=A0A484XRH2_9ENTR|nr:LysR family transcriptional regulator [Enterobacter cancerogenus]